MGEDRAKLALDVYRHRLYREIGPPENPVRVLVVESREDVEIAEQTCRVRTSHRRQTAGP